MSEPSSQIIVRGAKQNNLKGVDLEISPGKLTVFTGLSGSGKTTLLFDVIHAEGQRKYVETFSPYVRQFLETLPRPKVDSILNVRPSISVEQKNTVRNSRSTVGTMTEICDYFKVWFPQVAKLRDPDSGEILSAETPETLAKCLISRNLDENIFIGFSTQKPNSLSVDDFLSFLVQAGHTRVYTKGKFIRIENLTGTDWNESGLFIIIDRIKPVNSNRNRITESIAQSLKHGNGIGEVRNSKGEILSSLHEGLRSSSSGKRFEQPSSSMFSFNSPAGACPTCKGFGRVIEIDPDLVIPDKKLSIQNGAIKAFSGKVYGHCQDDLIRCARDLNLDVKSSWEELPQSDKTFIWDGDPLYQDGNKKWYGIKSFFEWVAKKTYKMHVRVYLSKYRGYFICPDCSGKRLKNESLYWRWKQQTLPELYSLSAEELFDLISSQPPSGNPRSDLPLMGIRTRLNYLKEVGLGYLSLDRPSKTLSGGETQRVNLTSCLGTSLTDTLFALDEPTIGLHGQDIDRLIKVLRSLADAGNCVCIVEHDEQVIRSADQVIEIGPMPGIEGGEITFNGSVAQMLRSKKSITGRWIANQGKESQQLKKGNESPKNTKYLRLKKTCSHNIRNLNAKIPLQQLVCIAGVSGSGKSTLLNDIIYEGIKKKVSWIESDLEFSEVALIDQSSVSRTPRSNPIMYADAWGPIREAFGRTEEAKKLGYFPGDFSFNSGNGRCESCMGLGYEQVEMQFLSDVQVPCGYCEGKRFKEEILEVKLDNLSIVETLSLTIDQAYSRFSRFPKTFRKLEMLKRVGLGYLTLGQPLNTLSGGESQRLKLIKYMTQMKKGVNPSLLLIDEPTTGLHFQDISKLMDCLREILGAGNSLLVIEHNPQVLKNADWIFEMGPGAGKKGGRKIADGPPSAFLQINTPTSLVLKGERERKPEKTKYRRLKFRMRKSIEVLGARENNLKNLSLKIPTNQFVVVTGPSGSGKSSLAFDVIFAEGQRRFMESMSSYARQFIEQLGKPEVDQITGISPTVAIEQRVTRGTKKSTVGSVTEVAQYLRLLYARIGTQVSIKSGKPLVSCTTSQVINQIQTFLTKGKPSTKSPVILLSPLITNRKGHHKPIVNWAREKGFEEVRCDGDFMKTENFNGLDRYRTHNLEAVVVRWQKIPKNIHSFVELALATGKGRCLVVFPGQKKELWFSNRRIDPETGESYPDLEPSYLSWNSAKGWCESCKGYGRIFDWMKDDLPANGNWWNLKDGETCPECRGERLSALGRNVLLKDKFNQEFSLPKLMNLSPKDLISFLSHLKIEKKKLVILDAILPEIIDRLKFMEKVGLDYLTLDRETTSLSGGEAQRIRLAGQLGSNLSGVLYVLDEPSIGLHPRDNSKLIDSLRELKERGNSLLVVEHDQETILQADYLIDVGPFAGRKGGEIVEQGKPMKVCKNSDSVTGKYIREGMQHPLREKWRSLPPAQGKNNFKNWIELSKVNFRNLHGLSIRIPVGILTVCCGVSGSGKSSLIRGILLQGVKECIKKNVNRLKHEAFTIKNGNIFNRVIEVSQAPIGKTPRSTPATYLGIWDRIRNLISNLPEAKTRGYKPSHFSFNVKGGRCETCKGAGKIKLEMNFLPDSYIICQECMGKRYKEEILNIHWNGKNIFEILDLTFSEAAEFFQFDHFLESTFRIMVETGLGYLKLGQVSPTLSGGEAQRLKLASELILGIDKGKHGFRPISKPNLYILEEPSIGLHSKDCENLVILVHRLIDEGNTVILIEHDIDLIAEGDHLIELGPKGGDQGGEIIHQGTVHEMLKNKKSKTAPFLKKIRSLL